MLKPFANIASGILFCIASSSLPTAAVEEPAPPPAPVLKVTYGEVWGPAPLMYSYAVWPSGDIRYEPLPLDYNGVKTREAKSIQTSPDAVLRAVNHLLRAGFLSLQDEVVEVSADKSEGGAIRLGYIVTTHSQEVTVEFQFEDRQFKTVYDGGDVAPWFKPALRKIEKDLGITRLVQ